VACTAFALVLSWHSASISCGVKVQTLLEVKRTCRERRCRINPTRLTPEADITQIDIPQCSGCCRAKMAYQPRTVGDKVMILPTRSGYTDG
jgi:hypothetical protein